MRRTLLMTLLLAPALVAGCGPRESEARGRARAHPDRPDQVAVSPAPDTAATTAPDADAAAEPPAPVSPMVAAMAQAHIEGLMADYQTLESAVADLRGVIQRYRIRRGRGWSPDPTSARPWEELIRAGIMWDAPANPFSPARVAQRVHVISEPGADGESVSPKTAGWVWNSADATLDAAWDSAAVRACRRERDRRYVRETVGPYLDPRLKLLRAQIALYRLYETDELWAPNEVAREQWAPLLHAGYVNGEPENPLSPRETCTTIVEVTAAGARGKAVDPQTAGWVWNSTDRQLYAAGYDQ